jgi:carbonic anhydrase
MKIKIFFIAAIFLLMFCVTVAFAGPHWTHEEQSEWGAIEDTSQTEVPLMFPFAVCSIGDHQSPVDLAAGNQTEKLNRLRFEYFPDEPVFYNSGHAVQVNTTLDYKGRLKVGKEVYPLIQFHFHEPSEHVVNGETFPAELHFVHVRENGKIAVLGVLIREGSEDTTIQTILDNMPYTHEEENADTGIEINPLSLLPNNKEDYYSLAGSLTTPPCSEGVDWYVLAEPITVSESQLNQLKDFYTDNARHIQDLKGRRVSSKKIHND